MSDPIIEKYNLRRFKGESSNDPLMDWIFDSTTAEAPKTDVDKAWNNLKSKIDSPAKESKKWTSSFLRVAASLALIAIALFATKDFWQPAKLTEIVASHAGQEVVFPDGSTSILNEQAVVAYPDEFGDTRTIEFEGEAFFDIAHDTEKPFIIKMDDIDVRVLGTAFNLTSKGEKVEVLVERGLVAFEKGDQQVKVAKGQLGVFDKTSMEIKVDTTPPANLMSWRDGKFTFVDANLMNVTEELGKYYGVTFKVASQVKSCRVTASFDDAPLSEVLEVLETVLGASITQDKTMVKIKGKGCQ